MHETLIVNARLVASGKVTDRATIAIDDGKISEILTESEADANTAPDARTVIDARGMTVTAGLVDTHIHGVGGFGTEDKSAESVLRMSEKLIEFGVTSFVPTLYPDTREELLKAVEAIASAIGKEKGAKILGLHIEGPFVSKKRIGALPEHAAAKPDAKYFEAIVKAGRGHVIAMTAAPELEGFGTLAKCADKAGVLLLAGHTDASSDDMKKAISLGVRHSTHLFNAMSPLHHRNPGAVGTILADDRISCELIADGIHVHPDAVRLALKCKPADGIALVTDSLKPNRQEKGPLFAGGAEVILSETGAFVSRENPSLLCGSALTLNRAVANLIRWGVPEENAVRCANSNPARIYSLPEKGEIEVGRDADICVFDSEFNAKTVMIGGKISQFAQKGAQA